MDTASIAVWDVPLPAVAGTTFAVKIGVKSHAGAALAGSAVQVCDRDGQVVASGALGAEPWPGTDALYWVAVDVPAPATYQAEEFAVTSNGAVSRFSVAAMPKPDHTLTVKIVDRDSAAPLSGVEIRLAVFHARTDAAGRAELNVCKGAYRLEVWRNAYVAPAMPIEIDNDVSIEITMVHVPEDHPDARWVR